MKSSRTSIESLIDAHRALASTHDFWPVRDLEVYAKWHQHPDGPVVFAGSLNAPICFLGRDLGKDEVRYQQPLIGAAGRAIRMTLHAHYCPDLPPDPPLFESAMNHVCITNTVPYKPLGNAPFSDRTRQAFRPLVERFLTEHWTGRILIPLGTGALEWCAPYGAREVERLRATPMTEWVSAQGAIDIAGKAITLWPLPHPSPLSQYSRDFPRWLATRLTQL